MHMVLGFTFRVWTLCILLEFPDTAVQGAMRAFQLQEFVAPSAQSFVLSTVLTLAAGAVVLNHIADENEARGLGSGFSLLIALPMLLSELPPQLTSLPFFAEWQVRCGTIWSQ